jgi:hypothetical protein
LRRITKKRFDKTNGYSNSFLSSSRPPIPPGPPLFVLSRTAPIRLMVANDDTKSPFGRDLDSYRYVSDLDSLKKKVQMMKSKSLYKIVWLDSDSKKHVVQ